MAEAIPREYVLLPNRILVQESEPGSCIGTVIAEADEAWGPFITDFSLQRTIVSEDPEIPPTTITYDTVVFNRGNAQEVEISGVNYLLIHCNDVLAFIPPE